MEYIPSVDGRFGSLNSDGTWNGMVGMLQRNEADIIMTLLTVSEDRKRVVDFSVTANKLRFTLLMAKSGHDRVNIWLYLDVFTSKAWMSFVVMVIVLTGVTYVLMKMEPEIIQFLGSCHYVYLYLLQLGDLDSNRSWQLSKRLAFLTMALFGLAMYSAYCSLITSTLSTVPVLPDLKTFEDVYDQGYKVVIWKGSINMEEFQMSHRGSAKHKIYQDFLSNPWGEFTSFEGMLTTLHSQPKALVYDCDDMPLALDGSVISLPDFQDSNMISHAISMRKGLGIKDLIDREIVKMRQEGLIDAMKRRWLKKMESEVGFKVRPIDYPDVFIPVGILCFGIGIGIFALTFEKWLSSNR